LDTLPHSTSATRSRRALAALFNAVAAALAVRRRLAALAVRRRLAALAVRRRLAALAVRRRLAALVSHFLVWELAFLERLGRPVFQDPSEFGFSGRHKSHETDGEADGGGGKWSLHCCDWDWKGKWKKKDCSIQVVLWGQSFLFDEDKK
jgi:hypothetical protein